MKRYAIITAGGIGKRMKSVLPKQFVLLKGKPILMHTIERFSKFDKNINIIISLPYDYIKMWESLCIKFEFKILHKVVAGGETRFHSIKNALDIINENGIVAIHDGVRPFVSSDTIQRTFVKAEEKGNAVASEEIYFSIRRKDKNRNFAVDRSEYKEIQTPQTFEINLIKKAYNQNFQDNFTDDASVLEKLGERIHLVKGNKENIKITGKEDLIIAEALINSIF